MKRALFMSLLMTSTVFAGHAQREAFQPIIDAKPFGDMTGKVELSATAAEEQKQKEEIAQKFRMCGITDLPDGSRKIAFIDETSGEVASYVLGVGEKQNGFTLVSADYDREYATLTKDGLTFTLGLGKGLIDTPPEGVEAMTTEANDAAPEPPARSARSSRGGRPAEGSFKARLLKREEAKQERVEQARLEAQSATERAARRVQIERIKQGLEPTQPITLTAEEDAELEAAGVFEHPAEDAAPAEAQEGQAE